MATSMIDKLHDQLEPSISRRELLKLGAVSCGALFVGCQSEHQAPMPFEMEIGDAEVLKDGLTVFPIYQIGVIRREGRLWGVRLVCTHQRCSLVTAPGEELHCPCHGSRFNYEGAVLQGPAEDPLPLYPVAVNERGKIVVTRERR